VFALALALAGALLLVGAGCGGSDGNGSTNQTPTSPTAPAAAKKEVPHPIEATESGAEDIIDFASAKNRAKVEVAARELVEVSNGEAADALRGAGVPEERIALLQKRAQSVGDIAGDASFLQVSLAANQVSELMPEFYGRFGAPIPPEVLQLDYLDREAELRSRAGEPAAVKSAVRGLATTWLLLRKQVVKAGGRKEAAEFGRHVANMGKLVEGSSSEALQREARKGLALVDELEGVFRK
jgi:hypothetical protein